MTGEGSLRRATCNGQVEGNERGTYIHYTSHERQCGIAYQRRLSGRRSPHSTPLSRVKTKGIIAIAIAPGFVRTEMAQAYIEKYGTEAALGDIPLGEMVEPTEVAELIAFVLRPDQRSLNGVTIDINGGSYIR